MSIHLCFLPYLRQGLLFIRMHSISSQLWSSGWYFCICIQTCQRSTGCTSMLCVHGQCKLQDSELRTQFFFWKILVPTKPSLQPPAMFFFFQLYISFSSNLYLSNFLYLKSFLESMGHLFSIHVFKCFTIISWVFFHFVEYMLQYVTITVK